MPPVWAIIGTDSASPVVFPYTDSAPTLGPSLNTLISATDAGGFYGSSKPGGLGGQLPDGVTLEGDDNGNLLDIRAPAGVYMVRLYVNGNGEGSPTFLACAYSGLEGVLTLAFGAAGTIEQLSYVANDGELLLQNFDNSVWNDGPGEISVSYAELFFIRISPIS